MAYHGIPWRGIGFHGVAKDSMAPRGVPWHAMGGTIATPVATASALHGNLTACHGNPHGTPTPAAPRLGLRLGLHGMPWRSVEGSVVCRGKFCRRWCHGMSRKKKITYMRRLFREMLRHGHPRFAIYPIAATYFRHQPPRGAYGKQLSRNLKSTCRNTRRGCLWLLRRGDY